VNGNYGPENCTWIPLGEQTRNKRNNVWFTYKNETKLLADWAKEFNISSANATRWNKSGKLEKKLDERFGEK
jgi:hypothetical protein